MVKKYMHFHSSIRLFSEPGLPFSKVRFRNYVQKQHHFYTLFLKTSAKEDSG